MLLLPFIHFIVNLSKTDSSIDILHLRYFQTDWWLQRNLTHTTSSILFRESAEIAAEHSETFNVTYDLEVTFFSEPFMPDASLMGGVFRFPFCSCFLKAKKVHNWDKESSTIQQLLIKETQNPWKLGLKQCNTYEYEPK